MSSQPTGSRPGPGGWWPVPDRSMMPSVLGLPVWAAVGLAAAATVLGVCADLFRSGTLGAVFTGCYLVGCLLAVFWVRRDGLFWTLVQPPLLVAVAVPLVALLAGIRRLGPGLGQQVLVLAAPLVNTFPTLALTTGLTLAVGGFRLLTQRLRPPRRKGPVSSRSEPAANAAPGAAQKSGSPPPS